MSQKNVRRIPMRQLRRIINEEAKALLQGKDRPEDVSPDEKPWEEGEDVGKVDFVKQMDKPTPAVKAEARLRYLKRYRARLQRRLSETHRRIAAFEDRLVEYRRRSQRSRRSRR